MDQIQRNKVGAALESWWPIVPGIMGWIGAMKCLDDAQRASTANNIAGPLISLMAIWVGFVAAAMTILVTAPQVAIIRRLITTKAFARFIRFHAVAIYAGTVASLLSLVMMLLFKKDDGWDYVSQQCKDVLFGVWAASVCTALACFIRIVYLLSKTLSNEHRKNDPGR